MASDSPLLKHSGLGRKEEATPHTPGRYSEPNATSSLAIQAARKITTTNLAYRYSPLPNGHIRLLRLLPSHVENAPLECDLFEFPLLESGGATHPYHALSYVWGSPDNTQSISIGNSHAAIPANLHGALLRLRDRFFERIIWADAICINQEDLKERGHQVRYMALIYAKASCVNVWLGEETDNSELALEYIRRAANGDSLEREESEYTLHLPFSRLFERPWFKRIWVLQEVAAAQHILIMCGPAEISGHTFCSGLTSPPMRRLAVQGTHQSVIQTKMYLMRHTISQSKRAIHATDHLSLEISTLGELIDMYHAREASDPRDKIYALLGMSSDGPISTLLSPDYEISWKDLLANLVNVFFGEPTSIETWDDKELAVILSKGYVLGWVKSIKQGGLGADEQQTITIATRWLYNSNSESGLFQWPLGNLGTPIREGDIFYLPRGASRPMVIRMYGDYCAVIAIAFVVPTSDKSRLAQYDHQVCSLAKRASTFDFLLVWDWKHSGKTYGVIQYFKSSISIQLQTRSWDPLAAVQDEIARLRNFEPILKHFRKRDQGISNYIEETAAYKIMVELVSRFRDAEIVLNWLDYYIRTFQKVRPFFNNRGLD
ncbi:heterokaryon incompatibility protein-domain-containing protein [Nemania sp. NC0429]|nr:heterokaryon incompatibility protein-domain-containing protein [Nemania sp. NC0429]